jgi:lysyl-tRNA synthetase, class II
MIEKSLEQIREERIKKLELIRKQFKDPFSYTKFERSHSAAQLIEKYAKLEPGAKVEKDIVRVAGRIKSVRSHGGTGFLDLEDMTGKVQLWISESDVKKDTFALFEQVDIGDIVGAAGYITKTKRGELSVFVQEIDLLAKSLRPLPGKSGFKDTEKRYRERYVDLVVNPEVRELFIKRTRIISSMRKFMDGHGFLEVETPVLQPIYGGALAKPFVTHHNALDRRLYLRISNELYLKRLIVGGLEKVYEIVKDFRNEGIDTRHNPEFTMMEFYCAYIDYNDVMKLVEEMIDSIAMDVNGTTKIRYKDWDIDLAAPWKRMSMADAIKQYTGIDIHKDKLDVILKKAGEKKCKLASDCTLGDAMMAIFDELVQPNLIQPTFITDYPVEISPLAKKKPDEPSLTERFEVFIGTEECGNAFSELNDPIDQRQRFEDQGKRRQKGDEEAHQMDEDYVRAMEYGMPPTGGFGIGVDRLTMLLTNTPSIREVILFPQLKETDVEKKKSTE